MPSPAAELILALIDQGIITEQQAVEEAGTEMPAATGLPARETIELRWADADIANAMQVARDEFNVKDSDLTETIAQIEGAAPEDTEAAKQAAADIITRLGQNIRGARLIKEGAAPITAWDRELGKEVVILNRTALWNPVTKRTELFGEGDRVPEGVTFLEDAFAQAQDEDLPRPVSPGLPPGYEAIVPIPEADQRAAAAERRLRTRSAWAGRLGREFDRVPMRYLDQDHVTTFLNWSPERIIPIQEAMVDAGLLTPGTFREQIWGPVTQQAMALTMLEADASGRTWETVLDEWVEHPLTGDPTDEPQFVPDTYMPPDYDYLAQLSKQVASQHMRRELEPYEVDEMAAHLSVSFRQQFKAEEARRQQNFEREQAIQRGETPVPMEPVTQVDPAASLMQLFETLYGPEIAFDREQDDDLENRNLLLRSIMSMDTAMGIR